MPPGVEFVITYASEPVLYVIKRQHRDNPQAATQQAFYYVLFGNIYQAPSLHACVQSRARRCAHHLSTAFQQLKRDLEPLAWRERQRTKRLRRTGVSAPADRATSESATMQQADAVLNAAAARTGAALGAEAAPPPRTGASVRATPKQTQLDGPNAAADAHALLTERSGPDAGGGSAGTQHATTPAGAATRADKQTARDSVEDVEREAAKAIVQQPPVTAGSWQWVQRTDDVILNVLARCAQGKAVLAGPVNAAAELHLLTIRNSHHTHVVARSLPCHVHHLPCISVAVQSPI